MKRLGLRLTIRGRVYGSSIAVTGLLVALAVLATIQFQQLGRETGRLSADTNLYMDISRTLEKATAMLRMPAQAAAGSGETQAAYAVRYDDLVQELNSLQRQAVDAEAKTEFEVSLEALRPADQAARKVFGLVESGRAADAVMEAMIAEEMASEFLGSMRRIGINATQALEQRLGTVERSVRAPHKLFTPGLRLIS